MGNGRPKERVLIVDDSAANIEILGDALKDYQRIVATDGKSALVQATREPLPDIILLDVMMPDVDGYEVCRRLSQDVRTRDIPVVFVTSLDDVEDETRGFEVGGVDFISKPIRPAVVQARVKTHLEMRRARGELARQNLELKEAARLREDLEQVTKHDLKNPLAGTILLAEALQRSPRLNETEREDAETIIATSREMVQMINRSLDLFKMERGYYHLEAAEVSLHLVVQRIIDEKKAECESQGVTVTLSSDKHQDGDHGCCGEELLTYLLLANLLDNAIGASSRDQHVRVTCSSEGDFHVASIHNESAVPVEIRGSFFEKYVTAGKGRGAGLGTYSAKLMAITQGGSVEMETSDKNGTIVKVRLPKWLGEVTEE